MEKMDEMVIKDNGDSMKFKFILLKLICSTCVFSLSIMAEDGLKPWPRRAKDRENGKDGYYGKDCQHGGHGQRDVNEDSGHGGNGGDAD
jgi:hypothetical protein